MKKPSRQYLDQLRLKEENKCIYCWKPLDPERMRCIPCHQRQKERAREIKGFQAYGITKKGRPPQVWDNETKEWVSPLFVKMRKMDWRLTVKEIKYCTGLSSATIRKYRHIFRPKIKKQTEDDTL